MVAGDILLAAMGAGVRVEALTPGGTKGLASGEKAVCE